MHLLIFLGALWFCGQLWAQDQKVADSLSLIFEQKTLTQAEKLAQLIELAFNESRDLSKAVEYSNQVIFLSEQMGDPASLRSGYLIKGTKLRLMGNLDDALVALFRSAEIAYAFKSQGAEAESYCAIADVYSVAGNFENSLVYYQKAKASISKPPVDTISLASVILNIGDLYLKLKKYDSAMAFNATAKKLFESQAYRVGVGYSLGNIGMWYASTGNSTKGEKFMNEAIAILEETQDYYPICVYLHSIADIYLIKGDLGEAMGYSLQSLQLAEKFALKEQIVEASLKLSDIYAKSENYREAYLTYQKHVTYRDSLTNLQTVQKMSNIRSDYELSQKKDELNLSNQRLKNQRALVLSMAIILFLSFVILAILVKNYKQKHRAFDIINRQKQETELQKAKAEDALNELKIAQKQLVQSAKMASLVELTAGVAHEIKNPLNFVNNFSEVSIELIEELKQTTEQHLPEAQKNEAGILVNDLAENLQKIMAHGKRADTIVKGMLQHLGQTNGKREFIGINDLVDVSARLSYQGLSTREKAIVPGVITNFEDPTVQVEVEKQELCRVLTNIINNAFYAVARKKEAIGDNYIPEVRISTKCIGNDVEVCIRDNGTGIPAAIQDKIFQPFFTTKPAGSGTGLGLYVCHDFINAHNGSLTLDSIEGEFTEFKVWLPIGTKKPVEEY